MSSVRRALRFVRSIVRRPEPIAVASARALAALDTDQPILILQFPVVRNNPFPQMLYSRCAERGIAAVAVDTPPSAEEVRALGARVWLHVHWTGPVLARARTRAAAERKLRAFTLRLDELCAAGVKLAWTVHNVLPHEHRFADLETRVCAALAERAALIHVLSQSTLTLTEPAYHLRPEMVRVIPHSSYIGVYPNEVTRAEARARLGLSPDATVLASVGAVRPYKGIERLLDAFASVDDPSYRLLIAGPPIGYPRVRALRARFRADPRVIARLERIPEEELQLYMNAADAVVLPYEEVLNSGALMLAFSFARPVIAARRGAMPEMVTDDVGVLVEPTDVVAFARALREADRLKDPRYRDAAMAKARARLPEAMSEAFANAIVDASS